MTCNGAVVRRAPKHLAERQSVRVAIAVAGYGLIAAVAIAAFGRMDGFYAAASMLPSLGLFTAGVVGLRARPRSPLPRLLQAAGLLAVFWPTEAFAGSAVAYTLAIALSNAWVGPVAHFVLAFPSGLLVGPGARIAAGAVYTVVLPLSFVSALDFDPASECAGCDRSANLLHVGLPEWLAALHAVAYTGLILACGILVMTLLIRRWASATVPGRRLLAPVLLVGLTGALADFLLNLAYVGVGETSFPAIRIEVPHAPALAGAVFSATAALMAVGYLVGLLRTRVTRSSVGELVVALGAVVEPSDVRDPVAHALGDDLLDVRFWAPRLGSFVDGQGRPVDLPVADARRAVTIVRSNGEPLAALIHDRALLDDRELIEVVAGAARLALERAQLQAELRAQLEAVRESRVRIVAAGDEQRKKIERDIHDGAQQRLVSLALTARMTRARHGDDPELAATLEAMATEARAALEELRELVQGLHPQILSDEGLPAALESLAERAPLPVHIEANLERRLPDPVAACAYFVCSEALANVAKYAQAGRVTVAAQNGDGTLRVEVVDDGIGGATIEGGTGLRGLADRVEALGGTLRVVSPAGSGTRIEAVLPIGGAA